MKKASISFFLLFIMAACGGSNSNPSSNNTANSSLNETQPLSTDTSIALANGFCSAQTRLQMVATSLLSAFSVKDNGSDLNYCGGESILTGDKPTFDIAIKDYCVNYRGQQLTLNGNIAGTIESGANFTSKIPELDITGDGVDLTIKGKTTAGRADDMFISTIITDNLTSEDISLEDVSLKKGKLDFGYFTLPNLGRYKFQFIDYFNEELTQGLLYIYGVNDELLIISADNGTITAVYQKSKQDPGTTLDTSCGV
jgi:hypothetical protein